MKGKKQLTHSGYHAISSYLKELLISMLVFLIPVVQFVPIVSAEEALVIEPAQTESAPVVEAPAQPTDSTDASVSSEQPTQPSTEDNTTPVSVTEQPADEQTTAPSDTQTGGILENLEAVNSGLSLAGSVQGEILSPSMGAGGVVSQPTIIADNSILLLEGEILLADKSIDALLKKDSDFNLREIQLLESAVYTGEDVGVVITIPADTKIFSPEIVVDPIVTPVVTENTSDSLSGETTEGTPTVPETPVSPVDQQDIQPSLPEVNAEVISSSFSEDISEEIVQEQPQATVDPMEGQATLLQSNLELTSQSIDEVSALPATESVAKVFSFGTPDQHLVFTKPVEMRISLPDLADGEMVNLHVKHAGDEEYNFQGISTTKETECDAEGNATIPGEQFLTVQNHEVVFYTCGASDFSVGVINGGFDPRFNNIISGLAMQSDGSMIVGGAFTSGGANILRNRVARVTYTGVLDGVYNPNLNGNVNAVAVNSDDTAIVVGSFTTGGLNLPMSRIAKITTTGYMLPGNFFTGNVNNIINAVAIDTGGSIYIGGIFTTVNGVKRNRFARVGVTGLLDTAFTGNVNNIVNSIVIASPGITYIGGLFTGVNSTFTTGIARVTTTGLRDMTFTGNITGGPVNAIAIDASGSLIVGGSFTTVNGVARTNLARISTTGLLDTTFNPRVNGVVSVIDTLPDGRIVVGGSFTLMSSGTVMKSRLAIFNPDGTSDVFDVAVDNSVLAMVVDPTAVNLYIAGSFLNVNSATRFRFAKIGLVPNTVCGDPTSLDAGTLDGTFNPNVNGSVIGMAVQYSNCVVVGGSFSTVDGVTRNNLARVTTTGELDPTFAPNFNNTINVVYVDSGNNILVGGSFTSGGGVTRNRIASITTTGLVDRAFTGNIADGLVNTITEDQLNRVIVGGTFTTVGGSLSTGFARLTWTGLRDMTFTGNANGPVNIIMVDSGGSLMVGGAFNVINGVPMTGLARVTNTGLTDSSFVFSTNGVVNGLAIQSDGKIIVVGQFTGVNGTLMTGAARVTTTGLLDTTFNANLNGGVSGVSLLPDGRMLFGGTFTTVQGTTQNYVAVVSTAGALDMTIRPTVNGVVGEVVLDVTNYSFYAGGSFSTVNSTSRNNFARIGLISTGVFLCGTQTDDPIGVLNDSFNPNMNGVASVLGVQSNGCVIVGGAFTTGGANISRNRIARVSTTGLIDPNFNPNMNGTVLAVTFDTGGNIYLGGLFTTGGANVGMARIAKVSSTGMLYTGFAFTGNANGNVNQLITDNAGGILVAGSFTVINGVTRNRLARIRQDGVTDLAFTGNFNNSVFDIKTDSGGKIVAGGNFGTVQGIFSTGVARLSSTGLRDTSFSGGVSGFVLSLVVQPDGKIIIGGSFTHIHGNAKTNIARLTSTGMYDPTFVANTNTAVSGVSLLPDGRILIGGSFTTVNGIVKSRMALLLPDGMVDTTFDPQPNATVMGFALSPSNGSVYVGGAFTNIDGITRNRMAQIGLMTSTCVGFSGCAMWLKADAGVTLSGGTTVSAWKSQGAQVITGIMSTGAWQPLYVDDALNYNPVLRFDGVNDGLVAINNFYDHDTTQFIVFRTSDKTGTLTTTANITGFAATSCGRVFNISGGKLTTVLSGDRITSTLPVDTNRPQLGTWSYGTGFPQTISWDSMVNVTGTAWRAGVTGDKSMLIGNASTACGSGSALQGDIAEVLVFARNLSDFEEKYVESYLALKYGISLDQTFATDYSLPGTSLIPWNATTAGTYTNGIVGIGRNDASGLYQTKSRTSDYTGRIYIEKTGALADNVFLTWSNNGQSNTGWFASQTPSADYKLMPREWIFQETGGDMGNVAIHFETGDVTTVFSNSLVLFLDADGDFSAGATPYTGTYSTTSGSWDFSINIAHGQYMAFGYYDPAPAGSLGIGSPTSLSFGANPSPTFQPINLTESFMLVNQRFLVNDYKGIDTGYTTTLQLSGDLVNTGNLTISGSNLYFISTTVDPMTISGTANTGVLMDYDAGHSYQALNVPRNFIYRSDGPNGGKTGTYGVNLQLQINIPPAKAQGAYGGTLVYTIIEN